MSVFKDKQKTKDGRCWRFKVYYHDENGKLKPYVSKRFLYEKEAKAEERVFILNKTNPVKKRLDDIALDYFKDAEKRIRESTLLTYISIYNNKIKPFFGNKFIDEIKVFDVEKWKQEMQKSGVNLGSVNQYYVTLKEIFSFANRKYEMNYNPVEIAGRFKRKNDDVVRNEKKIRYISYEDYIKFMSVIDNPMHHAFFSLLYFAGLRVGEVVALTWDDIDFNTRTIHVYKTLTYRTSASNYKITKTKNSLNRDITMNNTLFTELSLYKAKMMQYGDFKNSWFLFDAEKPINYQILSHWKDKYFEIANISSKRITIHEFRHSHVSLCVNEYLKSGQTDSGKFMLMMSQRMGHSLRVMQEVYLHLFPTAQNDIVDLLNNL